MKNQCEAVISPANTSHFLQPCDQYVNRRFKQAVRELRDIFYENGIVNTQPVNFHLACGVHGFESITTDDIRRSFLITGMYPFNPDYPLRFQTAHNGCRRGALNAKERVEKSCSTVLVSVHKRTSDRETLEDVRKIINSTRTPSRVLQNVSI